MTYEDGICPGACNKNYRAEMATYRAALKEYADHGRLDPDQSRPEPPDTKPRRGWPVWCAPHESRIREALAELDVLAALIGYAADGHTASSDAAERVSGSAEPLSPSEYGDQLDALLRTLTGWKILFCHDRLGIAPPPARSGHLASAATEVIAWLGTHLEDILQYTGTVETGQAGPVPFAAAFGLEVLAWHQSWFRQAKAGVRKITKPLRCPFCRLRLMVWVEGEENVACANCGRVLKYGEYEAIVDSLAAAPPTR
jgi:hypothetical protein